MLGQVLELLSVQIEEKDVEVRVPRPLPRVRGDRLRLRDVYLHLIRNAVQYGDGPGRWVEIGWRAGGEDGGTGGGSEPRFYVRDNGDGIDERCRESIFRLFERSPGQGQPGQGPGPGSGLAICRRLIERHGGRIWVEPTPAPEQGPGDARGSTFWFTLGAA